MRNATIHASSAMAPPPGALHGHARVGSDLVLGTEGHGRYGDVPAGHDGAYVSVVEQADGSRMLGVDHTGYAKLFLYEDHDRWAFGSSFIELAEYVAEQGWPLTINQRQVRSFLVKSQGMFSGQLTSHRTPFEQIRLLPPTERAVVTPREGGATYSTHTVDPTLPEDYRGALTTALTEMVGFLRGLLTRDMPLVADITGGMDSRSVLAGLLAASAPHPLGERVHFRCGSHMSDDFVVAQTLCDLYGLPLNGPRTWNTYAVDPEAGYQHWRRNNLGINAWIYPYAHHGEVATFSGIGGEVHRTTYGLPTMRDQLVRIRGEYLTDDEIDALDADMQEALAVSPAGVDPRVIHYQWFRNRVHGGRLALRGLAMAPLDALAVRSASALLSQEARDNSQLNADIMLNLAPVLAGQPYDDARKTITPQNEAHLTRVQLGAAEDEGAVYGPLPSGPAKRTGRGEALDPFREAFAAAAPEVRDSGLIPPAVVDEGVLALQRANHKAFTHAREGRPVALTLLVHELLRLNR